MKRVIIIVFIMLLVGGSGIAGLMVLAFVPNPFVESHDEMAEGKDGAGAGSSGKPAYVPPDRAPMLYPLEDLVILVIIDARVIKRVYITARMVIAQGGRPAVENGLPRIESAIRERLLVYFQNHFAKHRQPDPRGIKREMVAAAKQVYGDLVSDVYLLTVFEQ